MPVKLTGILADPAAATAALQAALVKHLTPEAERVADEVRAAAPSKSGALRASIEGEAVAVPEGVAIRVTSSVEYAGVVEGATGFASTAFEAEQDGMVGAIAEGVAAHVAALNKGNGDKPQA